MRELVSRVGTRLRRRRMDARKRGSDEQRKLEFPGLKLDLLRWQVSVRGKHVALMAAESLRRWRCWPPTPDGPTAESRSCATSRIQSLRRMTCAEDEHEEGEEP
jgi:hypothetical protein